MLIILTFDIEAQCVGIPVTYEIVGVAGIEPRPRPHHPLEDKTLVANDDARAHVMGKDLVLCGREGRGGVREEGVRG